MIATKGNDMALHEKRQVKKLIAVNEHEQKILDDWNKSVRMRNDDKIKNVDKSSENLCIACKIIEKE